MRMASRRSHAPTHKLIEYELLGSAERDLFHETHCKLRSSAAVGTCDTSTTYSSPKGDLRIHYDV